MMRNKLIVFISATLLCAMAAAASGQGNATKQTPDALVADLYKVHNQKRGPFFQTKSRALVNKYFEKSLADMIWKDRITAKNEVGVIDGDPLYNAQDMEIKNFAIGKSTIEGSNAKIPVTFENFGEKKTIVFMLVKGSTGWRIHDIDYGADGTMRGWFKKPR